VGAVQCDWAGTLDRLITIGDKKANLPTVVS
jgi:hypothetical protein